jgi:hypothetical protein
MLSQRRGYDYSTGRKRIPQAHHVIACLMEIALLSACVFVGFVALLFLRALPSLALASPACFC